MTQGSFAADVGAWAAQTRERMEAIRRESAQRVVEIMQTPVAMGGNMPVDTGFLRASLQGQVGMGNFSAKLKPEGAAKFTYDGGEVSLVIASAGPADPITFGYTAAYARRMEYGFKGTDSLGRKYNQPGRAFVRLAAQQWQRVVTEVATEAQKRATK